MVVASTSDPHTPDPGAFSEGLRTTRRANRVRWIWLGTTIALTVGLVVGSYANYRAVAQAATTLDRGQADVLEFAQREAFRPRQPVTAARLDSFVNANRGAGLRYFAIADSDGRIVVSAGQAASPPMPVAPTARDGVARRLVSVDGRIRAVFPRPPLAPSAPDSARADTRNRERERRATFVNIMEFVPVALALVARARQGLIVAWLVSGILIAATLLYWRTSRQYELARQHLEEQRRLTVLGRMSAVLAHEIRNPLASLKGHAQLLAERLAPDTAEKRKAERVVEEAKRLEVITNDLLDFVRTGPMNLQAVDPAALLRSCVAEFPEGTFAVDTSGAPHAWTLDEHRFGYAVLANLLRNAVQASPPGQPAEARVFRDNGALVFTIRDHGPGLPAGQEARIFDPFFTTRTTGTGLGLAVARRVAELHGGRISAENAGDGGARFRVEVPANGGAS